ncbi:alpha/beta fold hydrolase [Pseudohalioglobus lutimaris]|uniref:Serine aminopeptidase S33 domain-containing protein n=1 Tax=Pseudohalioglobus lutimaris TaxID=1737061 RepID=A0A2N5X2R1_9GAMM|nr:alpha/beta fold hydrolase [Pseudohalioglobus lutimaris]PLW68772.1 hypothetical protein C0039_10895 [Pseudohalioglobus lutimaris]
METRHITAKDGTSIPIYWSPAQTPRATLLLQPALGIQAKLYRPLAAGLSTRGCSTAIMEQRGHGLSKLQPGYNSHYSFTETLEQDIPAVMQWLQEQVENKPRLIGGHSLGGHLSTLYTGQHPGEIHGVVHLACAFPFIGDYSGKQKRMLQLLCRLIPLFAVFPGYYPGHLIGFGEKESIAMMMQWRQWAISGEFDFDSHKGLTDALVDYAGPVISLSFEKDQFSTAAAVERALSPFCNASIERTHLGEQQQGEFLGHSGWAKQPDGAVEAIDTWLNHTL